MKKQHLCNSDALATTRQNLRGLMASAVLATLAACGGPGDETPPPPPSIAAPIAHPVVVEALPSTSVSGFTAGEGSVWLPSNSRTTDASPTLFGTANAAISSTQKVNIYDGETLLPEVAVVYLGSSWSFKPSTPLSVGTHSFTTAASNADGTTGTRSDPFVIIIDPPPIPTLVRDVTPAGALAGVATTFTVTGQKLPLSAELRIVNSTCDTPTNRSETGFTVACTPPAGTNASLAMFVYSDTQAKEGTPIGTVRTITVSTDPDAVAAAIAAAAAAATAPTTPATTPTTPTTTPSAAVKLTDTGITSAQCYKAGSDTLVSCSSAEAIALNDKQDGMLGRDVTSPDNTDGKLGFSYSTVGNYDKTECVKDNITGLTWEGKPASGLRAITNTYTNYGDGRNGDTGAYVTAVNAAGLCGYTDWRLPTRDELFSLVDHGVPMPGPTIDSNWLPTAPNNVPYWTPNPFTNNSAYAWAVLFYSGSSFGIERSTAGYVRLVR